MMNPCSNSMLIFFKYESRILRVNKYHRNKIVFLNLYEYESNLTRIALTKIHLARESIDGLVSPVFVSIPGSHQTISCYLGAINKQRGQIF